MTEHFNKILDIINEKIVHYIPDLIKATIILFVGYFIIKYLLRFIKTRFEKRNVDPSLRGFLLSLIKGALYMGLVISLVQALGLPVAALFGVLSGAALAIGLALQGSLSNFAGGVLILIFRPFEVGDYIENNAGTSGTVNKIDLLYTSLTTPQGISVFSPNGALANSVISNYTKTKARRFEYIIGISYESNIKTAKSIILNILKNHSLVEQTPEPDVFVEALADSSINLKVRAWAKVEDYWPARNNIQEEIKVALDKAGISIPFPQRDLRIITSDNKKNDEFKV